MKYKIKHFFYSLIISLLLTAHSSYAQVMLTEAGQGFSINETSIILDDAQFKISPTVKVVTLKGSKRSLSDVKSGDYIQISIFKFNKQHLVDRIVILDGPVQEVSEP